MLSQRPKINKKFKAPKTLGEFRELAIDILKNNTDIPDRATLFTNPAGYFNINWQSQEDMEADLADESKMLLLSRQKEAKELLVRLEELKELGI